jgi:thiopurine S-methyltransferase
MNRFTTAYWEEKYAAQQTGWDTGGPATPFVEFFKSLSNKDLSILIPGCGRGYEGELLHTLGFKNVFLLDVTEAARQDFLARVPTFPAENFVVGDFFTHNHSYDLILEQTFFCALEPALRPRYAQKMHELLKPAGQLVGVLFTFPLTDVGPPFGGSTDEYRTYFELLFTIKTLEACSNSIAPRLGNEVFIRLIKAAK